jgi:hypothetical protein
MARTLLMFLGSPHVDSYLNVMANAVDKCDVNQIVLLEVSNTPSGQPGDLASLEENLRKAVIDLADGKYKGQAFNVGMGVSEYQNLKQVFLNARTVKKINYLFLREEVARLKVIYSTDAIVDVTGTPKRIAIDILAACLAVDMQYVTLFELRIPAAGISALYHNIKNTSSYDVVVLANEAPLLSNIEVFSARQNRLKLSVVVSSILISILLTVLYQWGGIAFGQGNWFLVGALVFINFVGGIVPIIDAWSGKTIIPAFLRSR